ncbi:MAG: transglutaminase domain-containing protein [Chloroflexota bacterium]|nr:transglutaminase domain-containing protein [Chloroflexota bacterium]MDE2886341.1 transglutaminase domain-containing protein [Chloroflexota bacterium]
MSVFPASMRYTRTVDAVSLWERFIGGIGLTITLVGIVLLSVALPLREGNWVPGMPSPLLIAVLGGAAGWAVHQWEWTVRRTIVVAVMAGAALTAYAGTATAPGFPITLRAFNAVKDIVVWLGAIPTEETQAGLIEFAMFLTMSVWLLCLFGMWLALRNAHGWTTVLFGGVMLGFALSNLPGGLGWRLGVFMASSVMLLIHLNAVRRIEEWRGRRAVFDARTVLAQSGIVLAAGLLVTAVVAALPTPPVAPLGAVSRALDDTTHQIGAQFSRMFSALPSRKEYKTLTYDEMTHFQGNPELTDTLLFTVQGPKTYWRARSYAVYTGSGWETGEEPEYVPFEDTELPQDRKRVRQTNQFRVSAATDTLFTGGLPAAFDEPAEALTTSTSAPGAIQVRFSTGREYFPTRVNLSYVSSGLESTAVPFDLRLAGDEYPEWTQSYLQLPETLPERVRTLAEALTANAETTYDKAVNIRNFLISIPYNLEIDAPPEDQDGVDYFLFESQQGYCDYYASAATVLMRAAGIPSRYVLGYAPGRLNTAWGVYEVLELNYHAWVEAYFPDYGWVRFEPTPPDAIEFGGEGLDFSPLPEDEVDLGDIGEILEDEEEDTFDVDFTPRTELPGWLVALLAIAGAIAVATPVFLWREWWWKLGSLPRSDELFAKMCRLGGALGLRKRPEQTPLEYALMLSSAMPEQQPQISRIVRAYVLGRYAPRTVPLSDLRLAEWSWGSLRWAMIRRFFRVRPA